MAFWGSCTLFWGIFCYYFYYSVFGFCWKAHIHFQKHYGFFLILILTQLSVCRSWVRSSKEVVMIGDIRFVIAVTDIAIMNYWRRDICIKQASGSICRLAQSPQASRYCALYRWLIQKLAPPLKTTKDFACI